ncbi:MAG: virginiamycin B lyase family protein [Isosphaeraceae bacterium]
MVEFQQRREGRSARGTGRGVESRKGRPRRAGVEVLETRELLSGITEFTSLPANAGPQQVVSADGYLWIAESGLNALARVSPSNPSAPVQISQGISSGAGPTGMTAGPNGELWFTEQNLGQIGVYNPANGVVTEYQLPISSSPGAAADQNSSPFGITLGPDGNIWFTEQRDNLIGMINPATAPQTGGIVAVSSGVVTVYSAGLAGTGPTELASAGGKLWITELNGNSIGEFDPNNPGAGVTQIALNGTSSPQTLGIAFAGGNLWVGERTPQGAGKTALVSINPANPSQQVQYAVPSGSGVFNVAAGSDGNVWFTESNDNIGMISPSAASPAAVEFSTGNPNSTTNWIATGPDGNVWFTDQFTGQFGTMPITQLVTSAPSGVVAGTPFTLTIRDQYTTTGATDTLFNGPVTLALTAGPAALGGSLSANAVSGVATFTLTASQAGTYAIQASGNGSSTLTPSFGVTAATTPTPTPTTPTPTPPPIPTIVGEQIILGRNFNIKKHRPIGKPFVEVRLIFSTAMNAGTIASSGNYSVNWSITKRFRKQVRTINHRVPIRSVMVDPTGTVVTLATPVPVQRFARGGLVTIVSPSSILGAAGGVLGGTTSFTILPHARGITPA